MGKHYQYTSRVNKGVLVDSGTTFLSISSSEAFLSLSKTRIGSQADENIHSKTNRKDTDFQSQQFVQNL